MLARHLPQLAFPVEEGVSGSEAYRTAVLRGVPVESLSQARRLVLERPDLVELELYPSLAGRIPCLVVRRRHDWLEEFRRI